MQLPKADIPQAGLTLWHTMQAIGPALPHQNIQKYTSPMRHADIPYFPPAKTRTHEVCGAGGIVFAFALAARLAGNALWVRETWPSSQINPHGFSRFVAPSGLSVCNTKDQTAAGGAAQADCGLSVGA
jgi:protein ImuA